MKWIKKTNDFVLGIMMIFVSMFLMFGNITDNVPATSQGGTLARADVWIQMIAVILAVVSVLLIIKSIDFQGKGTGEKEKFSFALDSTVVCITAILILYALLLPVVGFFITTFAAIFFLVFLFTLREEKLALRKLTKKDAVRITVKSVITALVMLVVLWLIFAKLLAIQLP